MTDADKARPIVLPSLGNEYELGQFYNAYTNTFYDGYSAWSAEQVKKTQVIDDGKSHTEFSLSTNDDKRNENAGLDVEGSVSLKLALFEVTGSAKYLNETKSHAYEARVGATCRVKTRERWMPMEQMMNRKYDIVLGNPDFTHFVSKVVEGGQAHITFSQKCSSSEEETQLKGALEGTLRKFVTVEGKLALDKKDEVKKEQSSCEVKLTGDYNPTNPIVTFADAVEEAAHLPQRLQGKTHTLTVRLLPVHMLESRALRICRSLDQTDMINVSTVLGDFQQAQLQFDYTSKEVVNKNWFPNIYEQVQSMARHLRDAYFAFKNVCKTILPQLRGAQDETTPKPTLRNAIKKAENAVKIAYRFVEAKKKEKISVDRIIKEADRQQIINDLTNEVSTSSRCLSLSLAAVDTKEHCLQKKLGRCEELITLCLSGSELARDDDYYADDYDDDDEWYQNNSTIMQNVFSNLDTLGETKKINEEGKVLESMKYCIGRIAKISRIPVPCGNIVAVDERGMMREAIFHGQLTGVRVNEEKREERSFVSVQWNDESLGDDIARCRITYWKICDDTEKPSSNEEGGARRKNEHKDVEIVTSSKVTFPEGLLEDGCYYGFSVQALSKFVGLSPPSDAVVLQTSRAPSIVSKIVKFYNHNKTSIVKSGWELDKKTNFLVVGRQTDERCTWGDLQTGNVAVDLVDVMPEYEPCIQAPEDDKDAKVVLMTGESGHGKSTHINGFFNWIFRISSQDPIRLLLVDDRKHSGLHSVTKKITVYRIRPHTGARIKEPLYVIDTPGFGNFEGITADEYVARTYRALFRLITKIDCVALAMRAFESRSSPKTKAVLHNILHQFGLNVKDNIIALLTFADAAKPPALLALGEVKVPLHQSVKINNASFVCTGEAAASESNEDGTDSKEFRELYWPLYESGNRRMFEAIENLVAVPAGQSAKVTEERAKLNGRLSFLRESIINSVNRGNKISADLDVIKLCITAPSNRDALIKVNVRETQRIDLPSGAQSTLCNVCNFTCHQVCSDGKETCWAMDGHGYCTQCPRKCKWNAHRKETFYYATVDKVVEREFIPEWSDAGRSVESAVLRLISEFIKEQKIILESLHSMHDLHKQLCVIALRHNPKGILDYVNSLIAKAKDRGATAEVEALDVARDVIILSDAVGKDASESSEMMIKVMEKVKTALEGRVRMSTEERLAAQDEPSTFYYEIYTMLLQSYQRKVPTPLKTDFKTDCGNVIRVIELLLHDGIFALFQSKER